MTDPYKSFFERIITPTARSFFIQLRLVTNHSSLKTQLFSKPQKCSPS